MSGYGKTALQRLLSFLPYIIMFIISFIYFGFIAGYICFFQEKSSLFVFSHDYLIDNLNQPGSLLIYLGKLLTTFYYYPVAGAAVISIVIVSISLTVNSIFHHLSGRRSVLIAVLAGIAAFYLQTNYRYPAFNNIGLLIQIMAFCVAVWFVKGWIPVILFPVWYFVTGSFAWIFALMYVLFLLLKSFRKGWIRSVSLVVISLVTIYVSKEFVFFQPLKTLLIYPFSDLSSGFQLIPFLIFSSIIVLLPLIAKIGINPSLSVKSQSEGVKIFTVLITASIMILVSFFRFDRKDDEYFTVEKLFYQHRYKEVGEYLHEHPASNKLSVFLGNIALSETGKLCDELFSYRQSPDGGTLFLKWEMLGEVLRRGGCFYYTIGMINEAHRWAYENMVMNGFTPEGLLMLVRTEIINGNYKVASKYIEILENTLFYKADAKRYKKILNDRAVESDPELGPKRREKISHDFFSITNDPYTNIEQILSADSLNMKAFEYKLAYLLLKKDYRSVVAELPKLSMYGFTKIPVNVEEAAVIYTRLGSGFLPAGTGFRISETIEMKFGQYLQILRNYGNNPKAAEPFLRKGFENTYWYYAFYRQ